MTQWSKSVIFTVFTIGLLLTGPGWGLSYPAFAAGPYKGRVIDSETKQPIEGAVVLAVWVRWIPAFLKSVETFWDAQEVIADQYGRFEVGKKTPTNLWPGAWVDGPRLTIFFPGYGFFPGYHTNPPLTASGVEGLLRQMEHERLTIELPRLTTKKERLDVISWAYPSLDIPPERMPNLIRLINTERRALGLPPKNTD